VPNPSATDEDGGEQRFYAVMNYLAQLAWSENAVAQALAALDRVLYRTTSRMRHPGQVNVRPSTDGDRQAVDALLTASRGELHVVGHGVRYDLRVLPTLVADGPDGLAGVLTYLIEDDSLEVVSIDAIERGRGVGTALLDAAAALARAAGLRRLWLVTTNDNLDALRFYQRRGLRLVSVRPGAVDESRRLKPGIPRTGAYGIPLRDELTLEMAL
jgi:GNAT superfamily N-acetyltransferase